MSTGYPVSWPCYGNFKLNTFLPGASDYELMCLVVQRCNEILELAPMNIIKYANPILWDITSQYERNTVVVDSNGNAYLSVQPVPVGISLDRTEYWTPIGNFQKLVENLSKAITPYDEGHSPTATVDRPKNTIVWVNGTLYRVTSYMKAGDAYVPGSNCVVSSLNEVFSYVLGLDVGKYDSENEEIELGFFEGPAIAVAGDVHEYDPAIQTIKIIGR